MGSLVVTHKGRWMPQVGGKGKDVSRIWVNAREIFVCHFLKFLECRRVHIAPNTDPSLSMVDLLQLKHTLGDESTIDHHLE